MRIDEIRFHDWKCLKCNYAGCLGSDVIIDVRILPKSGLKISILHCPECGGAQGSSIHGCLDKNKRSEFSADLDELKITNWVCTNCNKDEMKLRYDEYTWGMKVSALCDEFPNNCKAPYLMHSAFVSLVPYCGESIPPFGGRVGNNPKIRQFFEDMVERWRRGELP